MNRRLFTSLLATLVFLAAAASTYAQGPIPAPGNWADFVHTGSQVTVQGYGIDPYTQVLHWSDATNASGWAYRSASGWAFGISDDVPRWMTPVIVARNISTTYVPLWGTFMYTQPWASYQYYRSPGYYTAGRVN